MSFSKSGPAVSGRLFCAADDIVVNVGSPFVNYCVKYRKQSETYQSSDNEEACIEKPEKMHHLSYHRKSEGKVRSGKDQGNEEHDEQL